MINLKETLGVFVILANLAACSASNPSDTKSVQPSTSITNQPEQSIAAQPLEDFTPSADISIEWWLRLDPDTLDIYTRQTAHHLSLAIVWKHLIVPLPTGTVRAINHQSGEAIWEFNTSSHISYGVVTYKHLGYIGTVQGTIIAFDARLGRVLWETKLSSSISAISAYDSTILARSIDGKLYRLNAKNGNIIWTNTQRLPKLTLHGSSQPLLINQTVLVANDSGMLLTINLSTGEIENSLNVGRSRGSSDIDNLVDVQATPLYHNNTLYASAWESTLFSYDPNTQLLNWQVPLPSFHPININDDQHLLILTNKGVLLALNPSSGIVEWQKNFLRNREPNALVRHLNWWVTSDRFGVMHWFTQQGDLAARYKSQYALAMNPVSHNNLLYFLNQAGEIITIDITPLS